MVIEEEFQPIFFEDNSPARKSKKQFCKLYGDGSHIISVPLKQAKEDTRKYSPRKKDPMREIFNQLYTEAQADGKKAGQIQEYLYDNLCGYIEDDNELNLFIETNTKRFLSNQYRKFKRAYRKANINKFNYFVTITYDDSKFKDEDEFKEKCRKTLSNFADRRGWRYMGVWEYGADNGRLHFHALMYIPEGELVGELVEKKDYSKKEHCMRTRHENTFFFDRYGRNDFEAISTKENEKNKIVSYILKYLQKTGGRLVYSRGLPEAIYAEVDIEEDAITNIPRAFVEKYVLFSDVLERLRENGNYTTVRPKGFEPRYIYE